MKRLLLACAVTCACAVACGGGTVTSTQNAAPRSAANASPQAAAAQNANQPAQQQPTDSRADVTGAYFPSGDLPAEFAEIEHLGLANIDENGQPAPLNGFIRPKRRSAADYKLVNPRLEGSELTFTTGAVGGISYSFKGRFSRLDNFPENPPASDEIVLRGTLKKLKGDQPVGETSVNFTYSAGG